MGRRPAFRIHLACRGSYSYSSFYLHRGEVSRPSNAYAESPRFSRSWLFRVSKPSGCNARPLQSGSLLIELLPVWTQPEVLPPAI